MRKTYFSGFVFLLLFGCAAPQIFYDYDVQTDFSVYKTYNFYTDMETGLNDLDDERVFVAIDSALTKKGIHLSTTPDFKVNFYASYFEKPSGSRIGLGFGSGGGGIGIGVSGGIPVGAPDVYMHLTIEFVEWPSNVLYWQTVIESRFNPNMSPEERSAYFQNIILKALEKYPPEKGKK
ncbi:MAG TPA: DUF4136 domain-containing protein [Flavobacteriaceae bacterium]|nr:DUF4136 domain-containing protein [Flavobacteriaceae bacterium]